MSPVPLDVTANSQITSRTSPTVVDLMTAVLAGAAGGYILSRHSISDSLPGVAIALALVPPLTVTGLAWSQGEWLVGSGALLLWLTNLIAILGMGGLAFVLSGAVPLRRVNESQRRLRTWIAALVTLACLVVGGLLLNGAQLAQNRYRTGEAREVAQEWLAGGDHRLVAVDVDGEGLSVVIAGPAGTPPSADRLQRLVAEQAGQDVDVEVRLMVEEQYWTQE